MKQSIVNFFQRAFAKNSLVHGALMAALAAVYMVLKPIASQIINTGVVPAWPDLKIILLHALYVAVSAFIGYLVKNGIFGSSNITAITAAPKS